MKTMNQRLEALEDAFIKHLEESGTIKTDLRWLKVAFWTLAGAGITFNMTLVGALLLHQWK